jgi:hypothetical protein
VTITYGFGYEQALTELCTYGITRREAVKALVDAARTGLPQSALGDSTGWTVSRHGRPRSSTEFTLEQQSLHSRNGERYLASREVEPAATGWHRRTIWQAVSADGFVIASALTENELDAVLDLEDSLGVSVRDGAWELARGSNVSSRCGCGDPVYDDSDWAPAGRYHVCTVSPSERSRFEAMGRRLAAS